MAGFAGTASLASIAAVRPDLGAHAPSAIAAAALAASIPALACLYQAATGAEPRRAERPSGHEGRDARDGDRATPPWREPPPDGAARPRPDNTVEGDASGDAATGRVERAGTAWKRLTGGLARRGGTAARHGRARDAGGDASAVMEKPARDIHRAERDAGAPRHRSRRHARIALREARTTILTEDRRRLNALVIDVSQSGVAVQGNLPGLWIGSMVTVGSRRAKAVRAIPRGMAFEFSVPIPSEDLTPSLVL